MRLVLNIRKRLDRAEAAAEKLVPYSLLFPTAAADIHLEDDAERTHFFLIVNIDFIISNFD
jgi:hypothetical protein